MNSIIKDNSGISARCEIWDQREKLRFKKDNIEIINHMDANQRIISISGGESVFKKNMNPIEIYGIFECWLFIFKKQLPYEIIAISWDYTSGGIDNSNDQSTIITKPIFESLYKSVDISELEQKEAAKKIGDVWMEQTGYVKK